MNNKKHVKIFISIAGFLYVFSALSCSTLFRNQMVQVSGFSPIEPPYCFCIDEFSITDKNGIPMDTDFALDFLTGIGNKYAFTFKSDNLNCRYIMNIKLKEKSFTSDLKDMTSVTGSIKVYNSENPVLLYQVIFTAESTVPLKSSYELYRVLDKMIHELSGTINKENKKNEEKD